MKDALVLVPTSYDITVCDLWTLLDFLLDDEMTWEQAVESAAIDSTMSPRGTERFASQINELAEKVCQANASDDVGGTYWGL